MTQLQERDMMRCRACGRDERASEGYPCSGCGTFICIICHFRGTAMCTACAAKGEEGELGGRGGQGGQGGQGGRGGQGGGGGQGDPPGRRPAEPPPKPSPLDQPQ